MKIGVFGGTFDPPHLGHLGLAEACLDALALDEVIFLPAARNPLKTKGPVARDSDRLEMVRRALAGRPKMAVSDIELTRRGPSYTVDTMTELSSVKNADYWFLVGTDAAKLLPQWKDTHRLLQLCRIAVVRRNGEAFDPSIRLPEPMRHRIDVVTMPPCKASSTEIRDLLARRYDVARFLPPGVLSYINEKHIYQPNDN